MNNKHKATIIASLALMAAVGAGTVGMGLIADAHPENLKGNRNGWNLSEEQKAEMQARHDQMEQAFQNNDYAAWKNIAEGRPKMTDAINEENFPKFAKMHNLMKEGKFEEAKAIRDDLGLTGLGGGIGRDFQEKGMMRGAHRGQNGGGFLDENNDGICDHMQQ